MAEKNSMMWRKFLNIVVDSTTADSFREEIASFRESYGDDPDELAMIYSGLLVDMFASSAGLFALALPLEEVPAALSEIRETLAHLNFEEAEERLEGELRQYYEAFTQYTKPLLAEVGEAMAAVFNRYVAGEYDPEADPNDLIAEALEMAEEDEEKLERAKNLIAEAGAIALRGRPLWWRWNKEAFGPAGGWLITVHNLVWDYTGGGESPLGPPEEAHASFRQSEEAAVGMAEEAPDALESEAPKPEPDDYVEPEEEAPSPVDEVIEDLIERGEAPLTPELIERCQAHREEAISSLIDLAADEYMQMENAPGGGYASIRAVQLLGELDAAEAIPYLIDIVVEVDPLSIIYNAAARALEEMGPVALEPLLDFYRYSRDVETKTALSDALVNAGPDDERVYEALLDAWEGATWDDGKCLLAHSLAQVGGERATPLLEEALEDPDLPGIDYNEVAAALEELSVEVPAGPERPARLELRSLAQINPSDVKDPTDLMNFAEEVPDEWREEPTSMAHTYTRHQQKRLSRTLGFTVLSSPREQGEEVIADMIDEVKSLTFDASTQDYPGWLRQTYDHVAECAGPEFQRRAIGILLPLQRYLNDDYDSDDDPDRLLKAASRQRLSPQERQGLFARAGALILEGRSFWRRWPEETQPPLSDWLKGVVEFREILDDADAIPLQPSEERDPDKLTAILTGRRKKEEPPEEIAELLDVIIEQESDRLPKRQLRRFTHRRAALTPHLIRMIEDKRYWREEGPGEGWAPILAVRLLGHLKAVQGADALVDAVAESTPDAIIHDSAIFSLMNIGHPARPAVQDYFRYGNDVKTKAALAEVLGQIGRRKSGDFDFLRETWQAADWEQNRRMVALAFGDLRDRRAIPLLQKAMEDPNADALDMRYVHWALQRLGASPPPPPRRPSRLMTPAPYNPRLIHDEYDRPERLKHNVWCEPLCPGCGKPLEYDEEGDLIHP